MTDLVAQLVGALEDLFATVMGECPQLLDEDRGGSANLYFAIQDALSAAKDGGWLPIETAPVGRKMFVVIGVTSGNGFTGGRPYTTDPYCVWQPEKGEFSRWPHNWPPTHWQPLPNPPKGEV